MGRDPASTTTPRAVCALAVADAKPATDARVTQCRMDMSRECWARRCAVPQPQTASGLCAPQALRRTAEGTKRDNVCALHCVEPPALQNVAGVRARMLQRSKETTLIVAVALASCLG